MKKKGQDRKDLNGIVIVNKPGGVTSHDVVSAARRSLGMRRIGHAGTLDPLATGVLILLVGKGTKLFDRFMAFDKAYRATMVLGRQTNSADIEGDLIDERPYDHVTEDAVRCVLDSFLGEGEQLPPMVSAVRVNGQRLYELARRGVVVERQTRQIRIDRMELLRFEPPHVEFLMTCSKGTYVRTLAEDAGNKMGCGACICQIERTQVGPYRLEEAVSIEDIREECVKEFCDPGDHPVAGVTGDAA